MNHFRFVKSFVNMLKLDTCHEGLLLSLLQQAHSCCSSINKSFCLVHTLYLTLLSGGESDVSFLTPRTATPPDRDTNHTEQASMLSIP